MNRTTILISLLIAPVLSVQGEVDSCQMAGVNAPLKHRKEVLVSSPLKKLLPVEEEPPAIEHSEPLVVVENVSPMTSASAEETSEVSEENVNLDEILTFVHEIDIPVPEVQEPSFLMLGLRSYGISFVYKLIALKEWLAAKLF